MIGDSNSSPCTEAFHAVRQREHQKDEKFFSVKSFYIWALNCGSTDRVIVIQEE